MPNPSVSVDLDIDSKLAEKTIAEIKKKFKDAFSSFEGFKGFTFSMSGVFQGVKAIETAFTNMSSNVEAKFSSAFKNLPRSIESIAYQVADKLQTAWVKLPIVANQVSDKLQFAFKNLPRSIESVAYQVADKLQTAWIKLPIVAEKIAYQVADKFQTVLIHGLHLSTKAIYKVADTLQTAFIKIVNFQFRPGAILDGIQKIYRGLSSLVPRTEIFKNAILGLVRMAKPAFDTLFNSIKRIGSSIGSAISSVKNFVFSLKGLAVAVTTGALGAGIFKTAAIAEDVERAQWKFDTLFSDIKAQANSTAKEIADTFKVNVGSIQSQMARAADVVQPLGLANKTILEMTRNIALLSQGAEAWTEGRYDAERASTALMKALTGEKEMLKEFGVVITDQEVWDAVHKSGKELSRANFAIAIYNKILERTPKLQEAAFGRIQEFTGRLSQFKEGFKTLMAAVGNFTKPIITALLDLFGTAERKLAELLGTNKFNSLKTIINDITGSINRLTNFIDSINMNNIAQQFAKLKSVFTNIAHNFALTFGEALSVILNKVAATIGPKIAESIKFGAQIAGDVTGKNASKARMILRHQSMIPFGGIPKGFERDMMALSFGMSPKEYGKVGPTKDSIEWAKKFEQYSKGYIDTSEDLVSGLENVFSRFSARLKQDIAPLKTSSNRRPTTQPRGFGGGMPMEGKNIPISEEDKLRFSRMQRAMSEADWNIAKAKGLLDKASNVPERTATMQGLTDAWTNMLTRAAGGNKKTASQSVEDLQHKMDTWEGKKEDLMKESNIFLKKISEKVGREVSPADLGYTD